MERAAALKAEGTALFKNKAFRRARDKYGDALAAVPAYPSSSSSSGAAAAAAADLRAVLHTNRALMAFKLGLFEDSAGDCALALEVAGAGDARAVKALFRRAQARARMDPPRLSLALKDLSQLLSIEPANRAAQRMVQSVTQQIRAQPAPVVAALDKLFLGSVNDGGGGDGSASGADADGGGRGTGKSAENTKLLRWILSQTFDEIEAKDLLRKNVAERLWARLREALSTSNDLASAVLHHKDAAFAVRALASLRNHPSLDARVSAHFDLPTAQRLVGAVPAELLAAAIFLLEGAVACAAQGGGGGGDDKVNSATLPPSSSSSSSSSSSPMRPETRDAMQTLVNRLTLEAGKSSASSSPSSAKACTAVIQGIVKWCVDDKHSARVFTEMGGVKALVAAADPDDADLRGMVALGLGRIFSAYDDDAAVQARVKEDILPLLAPARGALEQANGAAALLSVFMVNVSVGVWAVQLDAADASAGTGATLSNLCKLAVQGAAIVQAMVVSIFSHMVNDEAGRAVVAQEAVMAVLQLLMTCDTPAVRAGAAVAVAKAKAIESKYGFKADTPEGQRLLDSVTAMLSEKLPEKQRDEELAMRVQGIEALSYLMSSTVAKQACVRAGGGKKSKKKKKNGNKGASASTSVVAALVSLAKDAELCATESGGDAKSDNKKSTPAASTGRSTSNTSANGKHSCGYGLACIFRDLTMSKQKKSRDKLREMEVTEEQWEQFKALTKSGNDNPAEHDSEENVHMRVRRVVQAGGISALVALAANPNETPGMREALSQALSNVAALPDTRASMVTQGCLKPLIRLAAFGLDAKGNDIATLEKLEKERQGAEIRNARKKAKDLGGGEKEAAAAAAATAAAHRDAAAEGDDKPSNKEKDVAEMLAGKGSVEARQAKAATTAANTKTRHLAGQALARILISTNPEMLPLSRVMDSIKPMLALIRTSGDNLMEYEGLMALTNLLSMRNTESTRGRFVSLRGIAAVEYCQFSQHPQVRCAATECFCNVIYHEEFIRHVAHDRGERLRLWISFAEEFQEEEHFKNARAAMGGIAMMAEVPPLAILLCERGAVEAMCWIVQNTDQDELHLRAVAALRAMCGVDKDATAVLPPREGSSESNSPQKDTKGSDEEVAVVDSRPGDPKLAAAVLGGYTHTKHFDDVQTAVKDDLLNDVKYFAGFVEKCNTNLEKAVQEKKDAADALEKALDGIDEDSGSDAGADLGEVEIEVLGDDTNDDGGNKPETKGEEKRSEKIGSAAETVESAKARYEKAIAKQKECDAELAEARSQEVEAKQALAEYEPEVWTGGVALLSALTKLAKSEGVKAQCVECLRSVSERVSSGAGK
jgi:hypothetical protein